jgi:hypoxanthine phosphoribosyltransferase
LEKYSSMNKEIKILDKEFRIYIAEKEIQNRIKEMASQLNLDLLHDKVIFLAVLNGAFMFATDLLRQISLDCKISFVKIASYQGTSSSGKLKQLIGLVEDLRDHTVVILEDIVDTGSTLDGIMKQLKGFGPKDIIVVTLLFKSKVYSKAYPIDYVGFEIPNDFVVGYGLDYEGYGRNLRDIYKIV